MPHARRARLTAPYAVRDAFIRACRALAHGGLIAGQDGNLSVRLDNDHLLITPAGARKGELDVDDLCEISLEGRHLAGRGTASTEHRLHLAAYRARADVRAVVHAHPPTATGFASAGRTIPDNVLPELIVLVGPVALAPFTMPGTDEVGQATEPLFREHDAVLLANHGAVTLGTTLQQALDRMESLEHGARIIAAAESAGGVVTLGQSVVAALRERRARPVPNPPVRETN
jgi:L-fuculose-phosphate aldolase